jgi:hypothetical protein
MSHPYLIQQFPSGAILPCYFERTLNPGFGKKPRKTRILGLFALGELRPRCLPLTLEVLFFEMNNRQEY